MQKLNILILLFLFSLKTNAQNEEIKSTNSFLITGKVKEEKTITLDDLKNYPIIDLKDINTSCSPKREEKSKDVKAVLLKSILKDVVFDYKKSHMLNQFYFLFVAVDDYKMVFSFSEIFNTEIGNNLYVVTELEGKGLEDMNNRILLLSTKDIKGGSRNMKWLSKIVVQIAE
ncbi:MAG: hypothetical protein IPL25_05620 [Saprospiraceae bacterium]|nr:hypothetical protein [Candidatus Vicinibacter affinis]